MRLLLSPPFVIRSYEPEDAPSLAQHANNRKIWRNVRDGFPHPYELAHAQAFIDRIRAEFARTVFAIAVDDQVVGGIGLTVGDDVERFSAELGYWLAEPYWGRGTTTEAVQAVTDYGFHALGLHRIYALPYAWNPASCRVLEKAGYTLEGRLREASFKDGQFVDQLLYARIRTPPPD